MWAVSAAIALLVASVAGVVAAVGDFRDPRALWAGGWRLWVASGWSQLTADVLLLVGLVAATTWLRGAARHRVQFCTLASVLLHFWLAVGLSVQPMPMAAAILEELSGDAADAMESPEALTLPDYHWQRLDDPGSALEEFDRPVPSTPAEPTDRARLQPRAIAQPAPVEDVARTRPEPLPAPKTEPLPLARAELDPPEPAREESRPTRQDLSSRIEPGQPIPAPEIRPAEQLSARQIEGRQVAAERRSMVPAAVPQTAGLPAGDLPGAMAPIRTIRRAESSGPEPEIAASEAPLRRAGPIAELPATQAEAPAPVGAADQLDGRPVVAQRRQEMPRAIGRGEGVLKLPDQPPVVAPAIVAPRRPDAPGELEIASVAESSPLAPRRYRPFVPQIVSEPIAEPQVAGSPGGAGRGAAAGTVLDARPTAVDRSSTGAAGMPGQGPGSLIEPGLPRLPGTTAGRGGTARRQLGDGAPFSTGPVPMARSSHLPGLSDSATQADEGGPSASLGAGRRPGRIGAGGGTSQPGLAGGPSTGQGPDGRGRFGPLDAPAESGLAGPNPGLGGMPLRIDAPIGPGSLGTGTRIAPGVPGRRAAPDGQVGGGLAGVPGGLGASSRPNLVRSTGLPGIEGGTGEDPSVYFQQRSPGRRGRVGQSFGGTSQTEAAVERGIDYLVRHQFPDGRWALDRFPQEQQNAPGYEDAALGQMNGDTAATGLALLALLGAGYTHREGKHEAVVRRGIEWLLRNQQPDGRLFAPGTDRTRYAHSYGHAIAAIALCEAYGMTRDPALRGPTERAINHIMVAQHPERGGWRYDPQKESDTSVSGWKLMALKSAQMAGLRVPSPVLQRVAGWLDQAQFAGGSQYAYNPYASDAPEQREGRQPSLPMTAEGLLMRMYLGWNRGTPALVEGGRLLAENLPQNGTAQQPLRDVYYWYYATQVMFQLQGDAWKTWNQSLQDLLPPTQVVEGPLAGSWHPAAPVADRWAHAGGRHYVTCLSLLMLEVYYRHLPLYKTLE